MCESDWVPLEEISMNLQKSSDRRMECFKTQWFDFKAMQKHIKVMNVVRKIKGGSTLHSKRQKKCILWQGHSYLRKGLEAYFG
jgi:monofunctional biosynthetic peptidoglycan transglycosylase